MSRRNAALLCLQLIFSDEIKTDELLRSLVLSD